MSRKKKMTPAQKAAARWADAPGALGGAGADGAPDEADDRRPDQAPPALSAKSMLVGVAGIVLVAAVGYFSLGGMG